MKVIEHIAKSREPLFSFEIVPPPRGKGIGQLIEVIDQLTPFSPAWVDVTAHSSMAHYHEQEDGSIKRRVKKKRPGTMGICGVIQNRFKLDTVAHMLCQGFSREETEDALIELAYLGIHNVLALRGDYLNFQKTVSKDRSANLYAKDLVGQIQGLNAGKYLEEMTDCSAMNFCVGVAGYPEKHFEAPNLKTDIEFLKHKVQAGAEYVVTQMFFNNQKYFEFVSACRDAGITVPIVPGLKVIRSMEQLKSIPKNFYVNFPEEFSDDIQKNPKHVAEIGKKWAIRQSRELMEKNVPSLHFYVMNDASLVADVLKEVRK
jgi:methylenetetrahydrofolate reductase (NADPH)